MTSAPPRRQRLHCRRGRIRHGVRERHGLARKLERSLRERLERGRRGDRRAAGAGARRRRRRAFSNSYNLLLCALPCPACTPGRKKKNVTRELDSNCPPAPSSPQPAPFAGMLGQILPSTCPRPPTVGATPYGDCQLPPSLLHPAISAAPSHLLPATCSFRPRGQQGQWVQPESKGAP